MKKAQILFLLLSLTLLSPLITGCSDPHSDSIRFALSSGPVTLDPRFATDSTSSRINRLIYQRLVEFDDAMNPIPGLTTWQQLGDQHYRFTLTEDHCFHNGPPLTATDIKATYDAVLDKEKGSPHRASLSLIDRIEVVDGQTVDFYLNKKDPLFPGYLVIGILPAELIEKGHPFNTQPVGSGPFKFESWPEEGLLKLRRKSDQQLVEFIKVKDPTVRSLKLLRGEVDMLQNDLPPELITYLQKQGMQVQRAEGSNFSYLGFNLEDPETSQLPIRQAITYALNREEIIHYVFGDGARLATTLLTPNHWASNSELTPYPYDPDRSRQLLKKAGITAEKPVTLTYKTSSDPFRIRLATIIQQQLAEVGINVEIRSYDWGTFYGDIKQGLFQMYSLAWVGIKTPDIYRYVFHSTAIPPNGANRGRYRSKEVDSLIEKAESASTLDERTAAYRQLQEHVFHDLPYVPLWYEDHVFVARPNITGYQLSLDGNYDSLIDVKK